MALVAAAATYNAAVDVLLAAWEAYTDSLAANAEIQIVKMHRLGNTVAGSDNLGLDSAQKYDFGRKFKGYNTPDTTDAMLLKVGASGPLFFKLTNDANELT